MHYEFVFEPERPLIVNLSFLTLFPLQRLWHGRNVLVGVLYFVSLAAFQAADFHQFLNLFCGQNQ